jgi:hypothetical protein
MKFSKVLIVFILISQAALAQTAFDTDDAVDYKNNAGSTGLSNAANRVMDTNLARGADDLNDPLKQADVGGPAPSTLVNKHLAPANAGWANKTYFGVSLKGIQQMLNKYFISNPKLPNWWKQMGESSKSIS